MSFSLIDARVRTSQSTRMAQLALILLAIAIVSIAIERLVFYRRERIARLALE